MTTIIELRFLILWFLIVSALFAVYFFIIGYLLVYDEPIRYNCAIAEFSPDVPVKVKDECRKKIKK